MTGKFRAYVGDPDFHDGTIKVVRSDLTEVCVEIVGHSGAVYITRFAGVESVVSHNPEGMLLYALCEMEAVMPLRRFHFANSYMPDDEGGDSRLEISARTFSVEKM
ncbi:MAG: hypothetical protein HY010_08605 [Acidobacteria bacterium]|nr:hypothetical protein [Acidobacteriota bacterium]